MDDTFPKLDGIILAARYELIEEVGRGGFGVVYRGKQLNINRDVAVKILPPQFLAIQDVVARFEREAQLASLLRHPNTITIHDYGRQDNMLYIVMELLRGEDLADVLKRDRTMPKERILHIARQVLKSLDEAHEAGIIHRDLKPENIFLHQVAQERDFVKVLDFGIAKLQQPSTQRGERQLTVTGSTVGTPVYMSPEQAAGEEVDAQTDLYALGVIMYEMLTGRPPFFDENPVKIMRAHLFNPVPPLPAHARGTLIEHAILRALDKEKDTRYRSAAEFLRDLDKTPSQLIALPSAVQARLAPSPDAAPSPSPWPPRQPPAAHATTLPGPGPTQSARLAHALAQHEPAPLDEESEPPTIELRPEDEAAGLSEDSPSDARDARPQVDTAAFDAVSPRRPLSELAAPARQADVVPFEQLSSRQRQPALEGSSASGLTSRSGILPAPSPYAHPVLPELSSPHIGLSGISSILTVVELPPEDDEVILLTRPKHTPQQGLPGLRPQTDPSLQIQRALRERVEQGRPPSHDVDRSSELNTSSDLLASPPSTDERRIPPRVLSAREAASSPIAPHIAPHIAPRPSAPRRPAPSSSSPAAPLERDDDDLDDDQLDEGLPPAWTWGDPSASMELTRHIESGDYPQLKKRAEQAQKRRRDMWTLALSGVLTLLVIALIAALVHMMSRA